MSADSCIAYFGLRYDVAPDEIERLERRSDARQIAARSAGLKSFWGNFGGATDRYVLFVGTKIAILGPEGKITTTVSGQALSKMMSETVERLRAARLTGDVALHLEWQIDI